jgi:hypothetical protein
MNGTSLSVECSYVWCLWKYILFWFMFTLLGSDNLFGRLVVLHVLVAWCRNYSVTDLGWKRNGGKEWYREQCLKWFRLLFSY